MDNLVTDIKFLNLYYFSTITLKIIFISLLPPNCSPT